ncbi:MAG: hypothetical protein KatS3mg105_0388 [Gemmatales bacterium]|nr:MAG: hypothetical protein KatS3mg105_0388 [Gemmatales bacterium]
MAEVLVVIAIIGVLIGLLIPAIHKVREAANKTACRNNLRQIGIALTNFEGIHGQLPAGTSGQFDGFDDQGMSWAVAILPHLEQDNLYQYAVNQHKPSAGEITVQSRNNYLTTTAVPVYRCPSDGLGGETSITSNGIWSHSNYLAFSGEFAFGEAHSKAAMGHGHSVSLGQIPDGTSNTMIVGEYLTGVPQGTAPHDLRGAFWLDRPGSSRIYGVNPPNSRAPDLLPKGTCYNDPALNLPCTEDFPEPLAAASARSRHRDGVNVLMADGSVRFVTNDIEPFTWRQMVSIVSPSPSIDDTLPEPDGVGVNPIRDQYLILLKGEGGLGGLESKINVLHRYKSFPGLAARISPELVEEVKQHPNVKHFEQDQIISTCAQTVPTGIRRIGATQSSAQSGDGQGAEINATIAILDTGIDANHPDLNVTRSLGFGYATGHDGRGHGTHVAGIAAARDNGFGVVGVAPGARLWALKVVSDTGTGLLSDAVVALDFVTQNVSEVQIANMSIGNPGRYASMDSAVQAATRAGVLVVVAAGNDGQPAANFSPANSPTALTVAALSDSDGLPGGAGSTITHPNPPGGSDSDDTFASYSNYGSFVEVIAPGSAILSTVPGGGYANGTGTSMAAPHVAGLAALILAPPPPPDFIPASDRIRNLRILPPQLPRRGRGGAGGLRGRIINSATEFIPGRGSDSRRYPLVNASGF